MVEEEAAVDGGVLFKKIKITIFKFLPQFISNQTLSAVPAPGPFRIRERFLK